MYEYTERIFSLTVMLLTEILTLTLMLILNIMLTLTGGQKIAWSKSKLSVYLDWKYNLCCNSALLGREAWLTPSYTSSPCVVRFDSSATKGVCINRREPKHWVALGTCPRPPAFSTYAGGPTFRDYATSLSSLFQSYPLTTSVHNFSSSHVYIHK